MTISKKQIVSDIKMTSMLVANAVQAQDKEKVPNEQEKVLAKEGETSARGCHVDKQGFLTTKITSEALSPVKLQASDS